MKLHFHALFFFFFFFLTVDGCELMELTHEVTVDPFKRVYGHGERVTLGCPDGYAFKGTAFWYCLSNNMWNANQAECILLGILLHTHRSVSNRSVFCSRYFCPARYWSSVWDPFQYCAVLCCIFDPIHTLLQLYYSILFNWY